DALPIFALWSHVIVGLTFPALAWFGLHFPEPSRIDRRWPRLKWALFATEVCCLGFRLRLQYLQSFDVGSISRLARIESWTDWLEQSLEVVCVLVFLVAIVDKQKSASTADARRRLRVLT